MLTFGGRATDDLSMAYDVEVDPRTGAAALRVPIPAPLGRGGLGPSFALTYSSSATNSPFGTGWLLAGLPSIGIDTRERVPRWDGTDGYHFGGDELVPWLEPDGPDWRPRGFTDADWSVAYYRSRLGGSQVRIEKWVDRHTGRVHFRTRDARNVLTIYGARPGNAARLADPEDPARTFIWLPELQLDPSGNAMWVEYQPETLDGVDRGAPYERRRFGLAQQYLKRIRYGNAAPFALTNDVLSGSLPAGIRWCFQLVFDYGDHADPELPSAIPDRAWPARPDAFSTCRAGFEVRTYRLCRRILSFHDFDELGAGPTLVGALVLRHDEEPAGSTLRELSWVGHRREGGQQASRALPPLRMTYAQPATATAFSAAPVQTQQNVPAGFAGRRHLFVDLLGDGLPGILAESERAWFYKPNEGDGHFGAQVAVLERPATRPGAYAFGDVDRDGDTELAMLAGRMAGLFEHDREAGRWGGFRPFPALPHVEALGGRAQWVDLNGDGRPDVVIASGDRLSWFPSEGESFGGPIEVTLPRTHGAAPTFVEDAALDLFFADMNGDGLVDLVQVRNGRVEYWPSLGNGRFGEGIVLEDSPQFAPEGQFDASRIRFADLDGSGTADIVYLGRGEVTVWTNAAGNRFSPGPRLRGLPYLDNVSTVSLLDFLGDGRMSLVWSNPLPGRESALQYLPLTPGNHPRLLLTVDDSLGQETRFTYSSSARHYLRDQRAGRPWLTRLPSHVTVVERREVIDHIGGTRSVQRFEYRDGFFDGGVREFRGFGRVDIYDADALGEGGPPSPGEPPASPPLLTRTWFHLGTPEWSGPRAGDTYEGDAELPRLPAHILDDANLTFEEADDAQRAVAGRVVRVERYAVGGDGAPTAHPIDVVQTSFRVRRPQPAVARGRAAFSVMEEETLTAGYDGLAGDPRLTHHVTVQTDAFDVVVREAEIAYPRRPGRVLDVAAQGETQVIIRDHAFVHIDTPSRFELGLPIEGRDLELLGVTAGPGSRLTRQHLREAHVAAALATPRHHHEEVPPGPGARLLTWERSAYWNDDRTDVLPHGQVGLLTLVHHEEAACFAASLVPSLFGARVDDARLMALGYFLRDGLWWRRDETHIFGGAPLFFQRLALEQIDGGRTELEYDVYALELTAQTDAAGNRTEAAIDYHLPAPWRLTDANGTLDEVRYDPLGVVVATTSRGQVQGQPWGFSGLDAIIARTPPGAEALLADPSHYLQGGSRYVWYDLDAWRRDGTPPIVVSLVREELRDDGRGGGEPDGRIAIGIAYLDGLGRTLQSKTLVEPGDAIQRGPGGQVIVDAGGQPVLAPAAQRWEVSGHVVYDDRQRSRRRYEPFFSPSWAYENDQVLQQLGLATVSLQDAIGREVGQLLPNGTFTGTAYTPWSVERTDANDNVLGSIYHTLREARPADDPEKQALEHAKRHAGTSVFVFLDPAGREVGSVARGGATAEDRRNESRLDASGQPVALIDPRGLTAFTYRRDMEGRVLFVHSIDAGDNWTLPDPQDRTVYTWDGRGIEVEHAYDLLGRPTTTHVRGLGLEHRVEEHTYGEGLPDAAARNLRGRLVRLRDSAGELTTGMCDPRGQVLSSTRRFRTDLDGEPDWRAAVALDAESFTSEADYDALGRPRWLRQPDGSVRRVSYGRSGATRRQTITTPDGALVDVPILDDATYDAHGRRSRMLLGNGVEITYAYDAETRQLARQTARRGARRYQDVEYTRDPAGNIVRIVDRAHEGAGALITGTVLPARRDCAYDAHYRLIRATGRVHQALLQHDYTPGGGGFKGTRHVTLNNGAALEAFTREYEYDRSGNLLRVRHQGATRSWTTDLWISSTSNRSLPAIDPGGFAVVDPDGKFDAAGQLSQVAHLRRIDWGWRGTLTRAVVIERPGGTDDDERYIYGADAMRLRKITTRVVAGGELEVTEKVYLGSCERKRIRLGGVVVLERWTSSFTDGVEGQRLALLHRWVRDDLGREADAPTQTRIHYQLTTHQGSSAVEIAENGDLISYEEYFPYGDSSFIAGDAIRDVSRKEYRYSGKERDDLTGFYYYGYRYYAPWMGRWLTPDPIGPEDDLNLYQFVLGDPVGNVDPDGLQTSTAPGEITWLQSVRRGLTERQARAQFNAGRGIELGIQATRLRPLGNGNWEIVSHTLIPPRVLPYAQRFHSVELGEFFASLGEMNAQWTPNQGWPGADPPGGGGTGQGSQGNPGTGGDGAAGQQTPAAPGSEGAAGNDASAGSGQGAVTADPDAAGRGRGSGDEGQGTGSGLQGLGSGGGGQGQTGVGQGSTGEGRTSGIGTGEGVGPGVGTSPGGTGTRPGTGQGQGQGRGGAGQGQGGEGQGNPTGQGGGTRAGGSGDGGVSTGNPNGSPEGVENGSPNGSPGGFLGGTGTQPPQTGTGTPVVDATGNESGTGTDTGGTSEQGLGGAAAGQPSPDSDTGSGDPNGGSGTGQGRQGGQRGGNPGGTHSEGTATGSTQGRSGGESGGQAGYEENTLDTLTRWAGYANFDFSGGSPDGQRGGIPGGQGTLNLGWVGQVGFIALTALSWIGPGAVLKGLRFGFRAAARGVSALARIGVSGLARAAGRALIHELPQAIRLGWNAARARVFGGSLLDNSVLSAIAAGDREALRFAARNANRLYINTRIAAEAVQRLGQAGLAQVSERFGIRQLPSAVGRARAIMQSLGITSAGRLNDITVLATAERFGLRLVAGDTRLVTASLRHGWSGPAQLAARMFDPRSPNRIQWYQRIRAAVQQWARGVNPTAITGSPIGR